LAAAKTLLLAAAMACRPGKVGIISHSVMPAQAAIQAPPSGRHRPGSGLRGNDGEPHHCPEAAIIIPASRQPATAWRTCP
jgi:hypothetical protein